MFTFKNKQYKTKISMKSAITRDIKRRIIALQSGDIISPLNARRIERFQMKLIDQKEAAKQNNINKQKERRMISKTAFGTTLDFTPQVRNYTSDTKFNQNFTLPPKRTKEIRTKIRNDMKEKERNYAEKERNFKHALNGQVTDHTYAFKDIGAEEEMKALIIEKVLSQLYEARAAGLTLQSQLTLRFNMKSLKDEDDILERYANEKL